MSAPKAYAAVPGAFFPVRLREPATIVQVAGLTAGFPTGRLLLSELRLVFGRRRNQAALLMLAAVPVVIAVAVRFAGPSTGRGPAFLALVNGNGLFVALTALAVALPLFLPLAVSAIAADAVAGEANLGTLRYLLTVPVGRTRLLLVKFAAVVAYTMAGIALIGAVGAGIGVLLFGGGSTALLSGTQIGLGGALLRLGLVCLYLTACLVALAAIGVFASTLTEQPIAATIGVVAVTVTFQILEAVPQLAFLHPFLLTHYWTDFGELLRDPIGFGALVPGLVSAAVYTAVFASAAWARFGAKDVTS
ncbi:ABC transporter permease [Cryptosporangium sp. NPDC051539]|uniref:ABC transporter permease n=1 Tax=Cryptosporangium sp. NPDC051539 TaxID=3363962 RepID=UPI003787A596